MLDSHKMSEAEVSLRLAFYLIQNDLVSSDVSVAIDGAQVRTRDLIHFPIAEFLHSAGCERAQVLDSWQGTYAFGSAGRIRIHSLPRQGDVVANLKSGHILRAESKKGPLTRSRSSQEYPLMREALGQLLTIGNVSEDDILAIVVPKSPKFDELAARWRCAPLIQRFGIRILTVDRCNWVEGLDATPG